MNRLQKETAIDMTNELKKKCEERKLPCVWNFEQQPWGSRRQQIIQMLCEEEYGFFPKTHDRLLWQILAEEKNFCAGKVALRKVLLTAVFGKNEFSFPVYVSVPNKKGKHPFFVYINFRDTVPDRYMPLEEICDRGYAVISVCYHDVSVDYIAPNSAGYGEGLGEVLFGSIEKKSNHCGKIAMWAWAASRAMDYAQTLDCLDFNDATVIGHSRLGKTSLLTGVLDERFTCAVSNDSGCSGAALSRGKRGETVKDIVNQFEYWFCDNYKKYADKEDELPFDQHFLLAAMAPRKVYVASAAEDAWADPVSEFLSCVAASEVYEKLGMKGLECPDRLPHTGECFHSGAIGYHMRGGTHYLSREDWNKIMDFLERG